MTRALQDNALTTSTRPARWKAVIKHILISTAIMFTITNANLLDNSVTLSASSIHVESGKPAYSDCLNGIVDQKFQPWATPSSCCFYSGNDGQPIEKYFLIRFGLPVVIKTVLLAFAEDSPPGNRPSGADFYVGFGNDRATYIACGANPIKSGVYSCNGLVGDGFEYYQPSTISSAITVCEIRLYSLEANQYPSSIDTSSGIAQCSNQSPLLNRAFHIREFNCQSPLIATTDTLNYYFAFNNGYQTRFIHAVTVIGTNVNPDTGAWPGSTNLRIRIWAYRYSYIAGDFGAFNSVDNSYGFENVVGVFGSIVEIYRSDNSTPMDITVAWIGIFTTENNCPQNFLTLPTSSWSTGASFYLGQVYEYTVRATLSDCPIVHIVTLSDGSPVPSFITYDAKTFILKIAPTTFSHLGTYSLRLRMISNNKVTAQFTKDLGLPSFQVLDPFLWAFSSSSVQIDVGGPSVSVTWSVSNLASGIISTSEYYVELESPAQSSVVTINSATLTFSATSVAALGTSSVGLVLKKFSDPSFLKTYSISLVVIDRCNEVPISFNSNTIEDWGSLNNAVITGQTVYAGFTQTVYFAKPGLNSSGYSYTLSCGLLIQPLDAASTTLLSNQVTKVETSTQVRLSLNFATPGEFHTLKLRIYVVNQSNQPVTATQQQYTLTMNIKDICLEYQIAPPWTGLTPTTSSTQRQNLFIENPSAFLLEAQAFSFTTHILDSSTLCKKTFEWVDAATNIPITSTYLTISPPQSGPSPASILPQVQTYYPMNADFFMRACIKDKAGNVILASCQQRGFFAVIHKEFCDVYAIDATWAPLNTFWTISQQSLFDVMNENYEIAQITYQNAKDPADHYISQCITEAFVLYSIDEGASWFDKTQLVPQLQTYPASLKAKLVGTLKNSEAVLRDQEELPIIDVELSQICLVVNEFFFDQPDPISFQYKLRSTAKTLTFPLAREILSDNTGNSYCGPAVYQLFDSTGQALVDNANDYLSLQTNGIVELTLETANPYHTTSNEEFFLLIYKSDWFDVASFDASLPVDPTVALLRHVNVQITNCIVPELKWPTASLALNLVIGSSNPTVATHSDLRSSNTCNYPIVFELFWDQKNEVNDVKTHDFTQLAAYGLPSFLMYQKPTVTVNSEENTQGQYMMYLVAQITDFWQVPPVRSVLPVTINITARLPNKPPMLKDPLPDFTLETGQSQSLSVPVSSAVDLEGDSIAVKVILNEPFMTWDSTAETINIDGANALETKAQGTFKYTVELTDGKGAQSSYTGTIALSLKKEPAEKSEQLKYKSNMADSYVAAGQTLRIVLPEFAGPSTAQESVNLGETDILTYDSETRTVFVNARNEKDASEHEVTLTLSESGGQSAKQTFKVKVTKVTIRVKGEINQQQAQSRLLTAKFESASQAGLVRIKFSESVIPSESEALAKISEALLVEAFTFDYSTEAYSKQVPMSFECIKLKEQTMELQLTFEQPALVSTGSKPDRVYVHFVDERLFIAEDGLNQIEPDQLVFGDLVPQFSSPAQASIAQSSAKTAQGASYAVVIGLIVGQLAGKSVIERVVPLFMALQIAVLVLDYEQLQRPAMAKETINNIKGIITMEALNPKSLFEKFWPKAAEYMKNPANFISNINPIVLGAIGVVAVGSVVGAASYIIAKLKTSPDSRLSRVVTKVKDFLFFNTLIASVQVSYLTIGISTGKLLKTNISGYQLRNPHRLLQDINEAAPRGLSELVSETLIIILLVAALLTILSYTARIIQTKPIFYFARKEVKGKIGALYSNLGPKRHQLHFATFFFARRLLLALDLFFVETPVLKIELVALSSFAAIYYCLMNSPYADQVDTGIEIFNESMIIATNYWQLAFSDLFMETPLRKIDLGWFYIVLLAVLILVNFYYLIKRTVFVYITNWLRMRQLRKLLLKKQEAKAARLAAQEQARKEAARQAVEAPSPSEHLLIPEQRSVEETKHIDTSSKVFLTTPGTAHLQKAELNSNKTKQHQNLAFIKEDVQDQEMQLVKSSIKTELKPVDSSNGYERAQPGQMRHRKLSLEEEREQKKVQDSSRHQGMTIPMLKDNSWTLRAKRKTKVSRLTFITAEPQRQREAFIKECNFFTLPQLEAERLADHFISQVFCNGAEPNEKLDKQVIWITEAAQQRQLEKFEAVLADLEGDWDEIYRNRAQKKRQIEAEAIAQIQAIEGDSPEQHLTGLLRSLSQAQLLAEFQAQCEKMQVHRNVVIDLLGNLKHCIAPQEYLYSRLDRDTGHILSEIRVERLAVEQCRQKIEQLEKNWEEEDLEILHDITNYKESIEEMKQLQ